MMRSTTKHILFFVAVTGIGLPFAYFLASPLEFWVITVLAALTVICWSAVGFAHRVNIARFGPRMTFDETTREEDPIRMVQLIRYHLGWSPGKIAGELNRLDIRNHGLPWREDDVRQAVKGVRRVF